MRKMYKRVRSECGARSGVVGRRNWMVMLLAAAGFTCHSAAASGTSLESRTNPGNYAFAYLGDLHFDRPEHHDMNWVREAHPRDIRQIENYCRVTAQKSGALMQSVSESLQASGTAPFAVIQAGDFVEGLCGSYDLQVLQFKEAIRFVESHTGEIPFLMTKGNHDITGPGADEAYTDVMLPWLATQAGASVEGTSYTMRHGGDLFVFFDGYRPDLDWLENVLENDSFRHLFFIVHEPVVPYNARSQWHLFARDKDPARRDRLLSLLGKYHAVVLSGHLHHYSVVRRKTEAGSFIQLSMNSVLNLKPSSFRHITGVEAYGPDLVRLEPAFSPDTLAMRKNVLQQEKSSVDYFELAKMAGWGLISVDEQSIRFDVFERNETTAWRSVTIDAATLGVSASSPDSP